MKMGKCAGMRHQVNRTRPRHDDAMNRMEFGEFLEDQAAIVLD